MQNTNLHWAQIMVRDQKRKLMVMPSNNSSAIVHFWSGKYEGRIGWLVGPSAMKKTKLRPWMPFALDNDAFASWTTGRPWDEAAWLAMLLLCLNWRLRRKIPCSLSAWNAVNL